MVHLCLLESPALRQRIAKMDPTQIARTFNISFQAATKLKSQAILANSKYADVGKL